MLYVYVTQHIYIYIHNTHNEEQGEKLRLRPKTIRDEEDMPSWWKKWRNMKDYDGEHESDQMSKRGLHVPTQNLRPTEGTQY